jgi:hypothetical protein
MFGIQHPISGKNSFRIPDPWGKKAPDPGSATLIEIALYSMLSQVGER